MPIFTSNYPHFAPGEPTLLSTPERTGALPEYTGRGVSMAFIDAGFYPHPDLDGRILVHADASTNRVVEQTAGFDCGDLSWHGQMTSVIACGSGQTSNSKYRGIASEAKLVLVKVSTPKGQIKETDILRGLRWVADTHRRFNVRIVNISVGGDDISNDPNHLLHKIIRKLTKAGVVVIVAAGNRSVAHLLPPASAAEAITVGGLDDLNTLDKTKWHLYHHNYGSVYDGTTKPELVAPSAWIASPIMPGTSMAREAHWLAPLLLDSPDETSIHKVLQQGYADLALPRKLIDSPNGHLYTMLQERIHAHKLIDAYHQHVDGTSVSAPIVASVVAQILEANPRLTPLQIRAILTATANPLPNTPSEKQGAGILNASEAVKAAINLR
ncbi:MAG: S8 family serine peptidase [Anaerolineae bacterium]|nr:S8 family serine peptidase [Anaerolineae bacterium]